MSRDFSLYLTDIVQCCDRIQEYVAGHSFQSFSEDNKTIDAVIRNLEIIGEAVKNIPADLLALCPEVIWSDVARFRDVIAHQYFRIELTIVWNAIEDELDPIRNAAVELLKKVPKIEDQ